MLPVQNRRISRAIYDCESAVGFAADQRVKILKDPVTPGFRARADSHAGIPSQCPEREEKAGGYRRGGVRVERKIHGRPSRRPAMTNVQVLNTRPDVRGGYRVDVSRANRIGRVSVILDAMPSFRIHICACAS